MHPDSDFTNRFARNNMLNDSIIERLGYGMSTFRLKNTNASPQRNALKFPPTIRDIETDHFELTQP